MDVDIATLYWTVFAALVSAVWVGAAFIRDHRSQSVDLSCAIMTRLLESDKLIIENTDIQKYILQSVKQTEEYFRSAEALTDDLFFKAKAFAYMQLNLFDEILSFSNKSFGCLDFLLKPAGLIEIEDWKAYMIEILRHPFYRSILNNEGNIFGKSLRDFWACNKKIIESEPADRFIW